MQQKSSPERRSLQAPLDVGKQSVLAVRTQYSETCCAKQEDWSHLPLPSGNHSFCPGQKRLQGCPQQPCASRENHTRHEVSTSVSDGTDSTWVHWCISQVQRYGTEVRYGIEVWCRGTVWYRGVVWYKGVIQRTSVLLLQME